MRCYRDGVEGRGGDGEGEGVVGAVTSLCWGGCQTDLKREMIPEQRQWWRERGNEKGVWYRLEKGKKE